MVAVPAVVAEGASSSLCKEVTVRLSKFCTILMICLALLACSALVSAAPKRGGTLKVALWGDIETLDATKTPQVPVADSIRWTIWETLVRYVGGEELYQPMLAESWEWTEPSTIVFHLRHGVKFHNGTPFTSADVKFSIERMKDPANALANANYVKVVSEVVALDDYTVQFKLSSPYAGLLTNLDYVLIVSKANPPTSSGTPIGTGPFKFVEWIPGDHLTIERFADYWNPELPYLDRIIFTPIPDEQTRIANLESDAVQLADDISLAQLARVGSNPNLAVYTGPIGSKLIAALFVTDIPPMNNLLVRRAIAYCIDRAGFVSTAFSGHGTVTENIYSPQNPYYNPVTETVYSYNLEQARALFKQAGYPEKFPPEASPIVITIPTGNTAFENAAVILQSSLREAGVRCEVEKYDMSAWVSVRETKQIIITLYSYGGVDPSIVLATNLISPTKNNCHYYDGQLTNLINAAVGIQDLNLRKIAYNDLQGILSYECPFSVVAAYELRHAAQTYLKGVQISQSLSQPYYAEMWLDK